MTAVHSAQHSCVCAADRRTGKVKTEAGDRQCRRWAMHFVRERRALILCSRSCASSSCPSCDFHPPAAASDQGNERGVRQEGARTGGTTPAG